MTNVLTPLTTLPTMLTPLRTPPTPEFTRVFPRLCIISSALLDKLAQSTSKLVSTICSSGSFASNSASFPGSWVKKLCACSATDEAASPRLGTTTKPASASTPATRASVSIKATGRRIFANRFPPLPKCRSTARMGTFRINAMAQPSKNGDARFNSACSVLPMGDRFCRHQYPASTAKAASATVRTVFLSNSITSPFGKFHRPRGQKT